MAEWSSPMANGPNHSSLPSRRRLRARVLSNVRHTRDRGTCHACCSSHARLACHSSARKLPSAQLHQRPCKCHWPGVAHSCFARSPGTRSRCRVPGRNCSSPHSADTCNLWVCHQRRRDVVKPDQKQQTRYCAEGGGRSAAQTASCPAELAECLEGMLLQLPRSAMIDSRQYLAIVCKIAYKLLPLV